MKALGQNKPKPGSELLANLFRGDRANRAGLAWRPTLEGTFHVPERFGIIQLSE
jgi:hypothetical protein